MRNRQGDEEPEVADAVQLGIITAETSCQPLLWLMMQNRVLSAALLLSGVDFTNTILFGETSAIGVAYDFTIKRRSPGLSP